MYQPVSFTFLIMKRTIGIVVEVHNPIQGKRPLLRVNSCFREKLCRLRRQNCSSVRSLRFRYLVRAMEQNVYLGLWRRFTLKVECMAAGRSEEFTHTRSAHMGRELVYLKADF